MANSIKVNYVYTLINSISALLFPLITFPYISRVIMAEGVGIVSFYSSIIEYVVLLTSLGIPTYGIREIARVRDDIHELNKTASEILLLNLLLNCIGYAAIFIICFSVSQVQENLPLFILLSTSIFLTTIGCPWFFSGVEDFKYVTIRGLVVRTVCTILLFFIVKTKDDLLYYGAYTVLAQVGNNIINYYRFRKYQQKSRVKFSELKPWRHLRPAINIFLFNLITSIYLKLDIAMIGFLNNNESVGFYTAASRLSHMGLSLIVSLGQVTMPRLSNVYANNDYKRFSALVTKSYRFVLCSSMPMCIGILIMSPILIRLFAGPSFLPAIPTLRILSFVIVAISLSNLFGMQILFPQGRVKFINISVGVGAMVNLILNFFLIPKYAHDGAAVATIIAESSVTIAQVILGRKLIPIHLFDPKYLIYPICALVMGGVCYWILSFGISDYVSIFIIPVVGGLTYSGLLFLLKEPLSMEVIKIISKKRT